MRCQLCGAESSYGTKYCRYCGADLTAENTVVSSQESVPSSNDAQPLTEHPSPSQNQWASPSYRSERRERDDLVKYFIHGIAYSLLIFGLALVWILLSIPLIICGWVIGLIIAIALLLIGVGFLNSFLSDAIWGMTFDGRYFSYLVHGLVLLVVVFIVSIPSILINYLIGSLVVNIFIFLVYCPINGYLARGIGELFSSGRARAFKGQ